MTRKLLAVALVAMVALSWVGPAPGGQGAAPLRRAPVKSKAATQVTLTYLGAAGWEIADGSTVILVDPYLSRVPLQADRGSLGQAAGADRRPVDPNTPVATDTAAVDAHIRGADFILLHHSHFRSTISIPRSSRAVSDRPSNSATSQRAEVSHFSSGSAATRFSHLVR